jgi:hypothetical protein
MEAAGVLAWQGGDWITPMCIYKQVDIGLTDPGYVIMHDFNPLYMVFGAFMDPR